MVKDTKGRVIKPKKDTKGKYSTPETRIVFTRSPSEDTIKKHSTGNRWRKEERPRNEPFRDQITTDVFSNYPKYSGNPSPAGGPIPGAGSPRQTRSSQYSKTLTDQMEMSLPDIAPPEGTTQSFEYKLPPTISSLKMKMGNLDREMGTDRVREGILRIFAKDSRMRPGFSSSWVIPDAPPEAQIIKQYKVGDSTVSIYLLPEGVEALYHVFPAEYAIPEAHMRLIELTRRELTGHYPHSMELSKPEKAREYVKKFGQKYMYKLAKKFRIPLGNTRAEELNNLQKLSDILAKFTAGMGIIETILEDH